MQKDPNKVTESSSQITARARKQGWLCSAGRSPGARRPHLRRSLARLLNAKEAFGRALPESPRAGCPAQPLVSYFTHEASPQGSAFRFGGARARRVVPRESEGSSAQQPVRKASPIPPAAMKTSTPPPPSSSRVTPPESPASPGSGDHSFGKSSSPLPSSPVVLWGSLQNANCCA